MAFHVKIFYWVTLYFICKGKIAWMVIVLQQNLSYPFVQKSDQKRYINSLH